VQPADLAADHTPLLQPLPVLTGSFGRQRRRFLIVFHDAIMWFASEAALEPLGEVALTADSVLSCEGCFLRVSTADVQLCLEASSAAEQAGWAAAINAALRLHSRLSKPQSAAGRARLTAGCPPAARNSASAAAQGPAEAQQPSTKTAPPPTDLSARLCMCLPPAAMPAPPPPVTNPAPSTLDLTVCPELSGSYICAAVEGDAERLHRAAGTPEWSLALRRQTNWGVGRQTLVWALDLEARSFVATTREVTRTKTLHHTLSFPLTGKAVSAASPSGRPVTVQCLRVDATGIHASVADSHTGTLMTMQFAKRDEQAETTVCLKGAAAGGGALKMVHVFDPFTFSIG